MANPDPIRVMPPGCGDYDEKLDGNGSLEVDLGEELCRSAIVWLSWSKTSAY